jgi:Family of unknown function (DUF6338)
VPTSIEALGILLLLLPGFACALILQSIAVRAKQTELDKVVEALVLSFVIYLATLPFFGYTLPVSWSGNSDGNFKSYVILLHWKHLAALGGGAVVLALLYGANVNHDWLLKILRKWNVTERTARNSIWSDTFQDIKNTYILVGMKDGRGVLGYLRYYSDDWEDASLFLEDAAWVDEQGVQLPIDGPGILLTKESGIAFVSFITPKPAGTPPSSEKEAS